MDKLRVVADPILEKPSAPSFENQCSAADTGRQSSICPTRSERTRYKWMSPRQWTERFDLGTLAR
jgi:hypothetical protein